MNFDIDKYQSPWHIDVRRYTRERAGGHGKGTSTMIHMHPDAWLIGRHDVREERNQMHLAALREARLTTEHRSGLAQIVRTAIASRRTALAAAGTGPNADLCASCA
jgi:hypothetical protein